MWLGLGGWDSLVGLCMVEFVCLGWCDLAHVVGLVWLGLYSSWADMVWFVCLGWCAWVYLYLVGLVLSGRYGWAQVVRIVWLGRYGWAGTIGHMFLGLRGWDCAVRLV